MSGAMRRIGAVLALVMVATLGTAGSAAAAGERAKFRDWDGAMATPPAAWNIKVSSAAVGPHRVRFKTKLERVRRGKSQVYVAAKMAGDPRWRIEVTARWPESGHQRHQLYVQQDTSPRERVRCRGMESRWDTGRRGYVWIRIPTTCLDGPHGWNNIRIQTRHRVDGDFVDRQRLGDLDYV